MAIGHGHRIRVAPGLSQQCESLGEATVALEQDAFEQSQMAFIAFHCLQAPGCRSDGFPIVLTHGLQTALKTASRAGQLDRLGVTRIHSQGTGEPTSAFFRVTETYEEIGGLAHQIGVAGSIDHLGRDLADPVKFPLGLSEALGLATGLVFPPGGEQSLLQGEPS